MEEIEEKKYDRIVDRNIAKEMKESFLAYSMSVIVSRALPDVRDGLKPVHRRIIYAMQTLNLYPEKQFRKSATVVGEVLGKYHPHGDSSVYDAMVRMAQDFSFRYPLVYGQGNFGSIDGDEAAAMRYTEAKMSKFAALMVENLDENTVDFVENYDGREMEPSIMPSRFPNLLANGTTGIAVGMATNIPPHNLGELIDGCLALIENPDISIKELNENYIFGPDFPTGALILGKSGIRKAYETGRGSIIMRAKTDIETKANGRKRIVVTEIPYQLNKETLALKIASLINEKKIEGISDIRDESNREGIKFIIDLKKDVNAEVVLNQLFKLTALQSSFGVNSLSLVNGRPLLLNLKQMLEYYLEHQVDVIKRRTQFRLDKAQARAHILEGLQIALDHIDRVITIIRSASNDAQASNDLINEFNLSEIQAKAILDMRLARLTGLAREKLEAELNELLANIAYYQEILSSRENILKIVVEELQLIKDKYADERRSIITTEMVELEDEDLIPKSQVIITLTNNGYIKRQPIDTFKVQNRGGRGIKGIATNEGDDVNRIITVSSHDYILVFTNKGKAYRLKAYQIPEASRISKGIPIINLIGIDEDECVHTVISVNEFNERNLFFTTTKGIVKRTPLKDFENLNRNGKIAINLGEDDELAFVKLTNGEDIISIASSDGYLIRFKEEQIRIMGRNAAGVRGIRLNKDAFVVGLATSQEGNKLFALSQYGYGKITDESAYSVIKRGGKGVRTLNIKDKNGCLVALRAVIGNEDILVATSQGTIIKTSLTQVPEVGRNSVGVRIIRLSDGHTVSNVSIIDAYDEEEIDNSGEVIDIECEKNKK